MTDIKELRSRYKYMVAWGIYTGSYEYYRDDQVRLAEKEGAPLNALYKASISGEWVTLNQSVERVQNAVNYIIQDRGL
jgi:hypothetical protein